MRFSMVAKFRADRVRRTLIVIAEAFSHACAALDNPISEVEQVLVDRVSVQDEARFFGSDAELGDWVARSGTPYRVVVFVFHAGMLLLVALADYARPGDAPYCFLQQSG